MVTQRVCNRGRHLPNKTRIMTATLGALTWGAISAVPVFASEGDASDTIETVLVSARKQSEDSQRVPMPITVLTGQALSDSNDTQIQQLPINVPGLTVTGSNARQIVFALRGLG